MYKENIKKILDMSKNEKCDIGVACDKIIHSGEDADKMREALNVLRRYYEPITSCRRNGLKENEEIILNLIDTADETAVKAYINELKRKGLI